MDSVVVRARSFKEALFMGNIVKADKTGAIKGLTLVPKTGSPDTAQLDTGERLMVGTGVLFKDTGMGSYLTGDFGTKAIDSIHYLDIVPDSGKLMEGPIIVGYKLEGEEIVVVLANSFSHMLEIELEDVVGHLILRKG